MGIAKKITILFAVLSAVIIGLLSGFVWYFSNEFAFEDFYKRLETRVNITAQTKLFNNVNNEAYTEIRNQYLERLPSEQAYIIQLNQIFKASRIVKLPSDFYNKIKTGRTSRYRMHNQFYAGKYFKKGKAAYVVIVSAKDPVGFRELKDLQKILIIGFFLSVVLSFVVGWKFSAYMLSPLRNIIKSVKKIKAENLHIRLEVKKGSDEMSQLAETFNNMLNRLETAFETQNNFISNASHELRTPLTIISGEVELAMMATHDFEKQQHTLAKIAAETERLEHIITSLLGLAQSGFNGKNQPWEDVRMDELLWEIRMSVNQIYPDSKIEVDLSKLPEDEQLLTLKANRSLIKLALSNVVSNACKYSNNKPVIISIESLNKTLSIAVTDQGIGIPENDVQHIFEPFYRASNTNDYKGYGVGLPLTLNIVRLHRGSIVIKSKETAGTEIKIVLPTF
ncbi:MAG: two-component sensor histidine kinase [Pedobacter sp.]|jgi:signal transduction histidine kinase|nr:two-component sensor histidine kinase [Pedobacter sp.]